MLFRSVFITSVLLLFVVASPPYPMRSPVPQQLMSIIKLEEPCVRQGGICMPISDCDPENIVQLRGFLCPMQRHLDVECCYLTYTN